MSQSITEGMLAYYLSQFDRRLLDTSVWGISYRQDSAGAYNERSHSASAGNGWCCRQSEYMLRCSPQSVL